MPRTATPIVPDAELRENIQAKIDSIGSQQVREPIIELYEQRLHRIQTSLLSPEEIAKKRFKRLNKSELLTLALCFLDRLIQLQREGTDTEDTIRQLCERETALLERGYPQSTIAKNQHPLYVNLIRDAIASHSLILSPQNSFTISIPNKDTGQLEDVRLHYAQMYLKYDNAFYSEMKRSTTANNNIKQDHPQPVRLIPYLDKINLLLKSNSYTELAIGIAAVTGRRFSEIVRGNFSVPDAPASPYEFIFEGQLKKSFTASAYVTYSLVPAINVIEAVLRFRSMEKVSSLSNASVRQINDSINAAVNYQVQQHFQENKIISVLVGESRVTVQNLRGVYGEIATHFFCPNRACFPRFLASCLGHLIGDEAVSALNSPSTQHYFHYYLVDEEDKQIDSMGVRLEPAMNQLGSAAQAPRSLPEKEPLSTTNGDLEVLGKSDRTSNPMSDRQVPALADRAILDISLSTKERFQTIQGSYMSEDNTLISLMDDAQKVPLLELELANARHLISSLETQLADARQELADSFDRLSLNDSTAAEPDEKDIESKSENNDETIMLLVRSMSCLVDKFDLFLEQQQLSKTVDLHSTTQKSSTSTYSKKSQSKKTASQSRQASVEQTEKLLNHAIDTIMAHNDRAESAEDKWYIGISPLKSVVNSQVTIKGVVEQRKAEIEQHHAKHDLGRVHNRTHHPGQSYTDVFDFHGE